MADRIVLISDDSDFFDYIRLKLELRRSDELFMYSFNDIPERIHLINNSLVIVNSENCQEKTLDLIKIFKDTPVMVMSYNEDDNFKKKCYRLGAFDYMTLLVSDSEFRARILPSLNMLAIINKNKNYREILVKHKVLSAQNEVFTNYADIIDKELEKINKNHGKSVFMAIAPNEQSKFGLTPNIIETIILNNIRKNDVLMNFAPNKYFLLVHNTDLKSAEKLWLKIRSQFSQKLYSGISLVTNQSRQQLINEVLNKLHAAITYDMDVTANRNTESKKDDDLIKNNGSSYNNFKLYRKKFGQKIEQIITPVFYRIQQKYSNILMGVSIEQSAGEGFGNFYVKGNHYASSFCITSPGFAKINIDITLQRGNENIDTKRISLEPDELEEGLLSDLLEQFINEIKNMEVKG